VPGVSDNEFSRPHVRVYFHDHRRLVIVIHRLMEMIRSRFTATAIEQVGRRRYPVRGRLAATVR
jgi:hypothetical protein